MNHNSRQEHLCHDCGQPCHGYRCRECNLERNGKPVRISRYGDGTDWAGTVKGTVRKVQMHRFPEMMLSGTDS
jgi:hypothetical protein